MNIRKISLFLLLLLSLFAPLAMPLAAQEGGTPATEVGETVTEEVVVTSEVTVAPTEVADEDNQALAEGIAWVKDAVVLALDRFTEMNKAWVIGFVIFGLAVVLALYRSMPTTAQRQIKDGAIAIVEEIDKAVDTEVAKARLTPDQIDDIITAVTDAVVERIEASLKALPVLPTAPPPDPAAVG